MLVSKNWLSQFTTIPKKITPQQLGIDLTMHVVEVEDIIDEARFLDNVVVGKIVDVTKHDNADTLNVCKVDIGNETLQVVCGGSNVREGMFVAMGKLGASVRWHGEGEPIILTKAKIRGVESSGMICASEEIGLGEMFPKKYEKEILDLSHIVSTKDVGKPLAEALSLDDVVFDIDNKSMTHRPDLWGQYGMAREISAMYGTVLKPYEPKKIGKPAGASYTVSVQVKDTKACPRYMAVAIDDIEVTESPAWIKKRLMSVGVQPRNNVVDVTNLVMFELGQPLHAFDANQLTTNNKQLTIVVRKAKDGEVYTSLDDKEYKLTKEDLVIATKNNIVALAGVKGSITSGVSNDTTSIILESANFHPVTIRRTASRHGLRTDASARYEKSLDPNLCELALRRVVELLKEVSPKSFVSSTIVEQLNFTLDQGPIALDIDFVQRKMGVDLPAKDMVRILTSLGFGVKEKKNILSVTIPTWRATKDISIREDLVEEIARVYGYDNIVPTLPTFPIVPPKQNSLRDLETRLRELLAYEGRYTEVSNYSFVSPELLKKVGENVKEYLELENPIAKDRPYLRRHLRENLLETVERNLHRFDTVGIFEIGKVFKKELDGEGDGQTHLLPKQDTLLAMAYAAKGDEHPFSYVSTAFTTLMNRLGLQVHFEKKKEDHVLVHPGRTAAVLVNDVLVGHIGEVHPMTGEVLGLDARTAVLEVNLSELVPLLSEKTRYQTLSQYPSIERDIAFVIDTNAQHEEIATALINADLLTVDVALFDVFMGKNIPEGKKSMAYRITYRSDEKTLEGKDVDVVHEKIVAMLQKKFGAEIRA
ncbi:MAG: phenylalanine--tRNA ligase subunit beta [Candidatus Magasanikbacteria bacterium CG_4_9_14_0_2_um_filter_41_10]|uniref:Phenylalanine--tRNA ligase beta subunit n=1 Tax=Candidatus Magasanikbacteria bacterium CG_4_10_14_0_2_um_filter_41_31 TaxID=1974639 RepID=A0A2M7V3U4_9BACT|nr:MAG: phenylalanine--tRNA ligase subunit beta [Candidatus Magasanikbacteria bacterium CG1_02_41_34]PIZ93090.1 MAG: phenylalanine--tRNA ligase subunit beta [Candidatus Magasanikbacteria bacterium CG_4_10_14_0_2_um_filter_41_31]PJC53420.1 MAG: phenylalanine--tRNA ligase subunit beta [Candidatus Magasanikbacteria bacterium CG_4_9_14_0_2_um_filter_41_10]